MQPPLRALFLAAVAFTLGLIASPAGTHHPFLLTGIVIVLFSLTVLLSIRSHGSILHSVLILALWFSLGWARSSSVGIVTPPEGSCWIEGIVSMPVETEGNETRLRLSKLRWRKASTIGRLPGRAVLYIAGRRDLRAGDRIRLLGRIETPTVARNPGEFNPRSYWGIRGVRYSIGSPRYIENLGPSGGLSVIPRFIDSIRKDTAEELKHHVSPGLVPIAAALFIGDRTGWDEGLREQFAHSGLMHLFAISGFHVGILAFTLHIAFRLFRLSWQRADLLTLIALWLYVPFTGANPPVVRAAVMISMALTGGFLGRSYRPGYALALAYLVLLFWRPDGLLDAGFQLSFAGTAAVIFSVIFITPKTAWYATKPYPGWIRISLKYLVLIKDAFVASIAAFILTAPFIIWYFGYLPWFAPVAILPATLLVWLTMIAGWLTLVLSWLPFIPEVFGASLDGLLRLLCQLAGESVTRLPVSTFTPAIAVIGAVLAAILFLAFSPRLRRAPLPYTILGLLAFGTIIVGTLLWLPDQRVKLAILDVDQGDGILIRRGNRAVAIDGGRSYNHTVERQVRLNNIRRLDLLVLTHGDADHVAAVRSLAGKIQINAALVGPGTWRDLEGGKTVRALLENNVPVYVGSSETSIDLGSLGTLDVLHPPPAIDINRYSDNDLSLVLSWKVRECTAVFPGDISSTVEESLILSSEMPQTDLLLAAHHGSRYSTSEKWLETLVPEIVAISCGRNNPHGHPALDVLDRINESGAILYRTDIEGALIFSPASDGFKQLSWSEWW